MTVEAASDGDFRCRVKDRTAEDGSVEYELPEGDYVISVYIAKVGTAYYSTAGLTPYPPDEPLRLEAGTEVVLDLQLAGLRLRAIPPDSSEPLGFTTDHLGRLTCPIVLTQVLDDSDPEWEYGSEGPVYRYLMPGSRYRIRTQSVPDEYAHCWFRSSASEAEADTVLAVGGRMRTIDFPLPWAGSISVALVLPDPAELAGDEPWVAVTPCWADGGVHGGSLFSRQGAEGRVMIRGLLPGKYALMVQPRIGGCRGPTGWLNAGFVPSNPVILTVESQQTTQGGEVGFSALRLSAVDPWGTQLSHLDHLFVVCTDGWPGAVDVRQNVSADHVTVPLPSGRHRVYLDPTRHYPTLLPQWWRGASAPESAMVVPTEPGQLVSLCFSLKEGASIVGSIRDSSGGTYGYRRAQVDACDPAGQMVRSTHTDSVGEFEFLGLPEGVYLVRVIPDQRWFIETWFPSVRTSEEAERLTLVPPERREGIHVICLSR